MSKSIYWSIASLCAALLGLLLSLSFQTMAYWGTDGTVNWLGYWSGAILSYSCSITSLIIIFFNIRKLRLGDLDIILRSISALVVILSMLLTSFIIIAWNSGM